MRVGIEVLDDAGSGVVSDISPDRYPVVHARTSTALASASNSSGSDDMMMTRYAPRKKTGIPLYFYVAGYAVAGAMGIAFILATRPRRVVVRSRRRY